MGWLEGGDDPLRATQELEGLDDFGIGDVLIAGTTDGRQVAVLWAHSRIVEAGTDGLGFEDLPEFVLHKIRLRAVDHARDSTSDCGAPGGLDTDQLRVRIHEPGEDPDCVRATAHAGGDHIRGGTEDGLALLAGLVTEDLVEGPHHPGIRVGAHHGPEAVVGLLDGGLPVPHGLVDGVLERPAPTHRRLHLGAEQLHAKDIEFLAPDVDLAHVDAALHAEEGRGRGGRDPMLARTGLGDEPGLSHALGQQCLPQHIVDLVGASVVQILALEEEAAAEFSGEILALGHRRRPPRIVGQESVEARPEPRIGPGRAEGRLAPFTGRHEGLGDVPAPEFAETPLGRRVAQPHWCSSQSNGRRSPPS